MLDPRLLRELVRQEVARQVGPARRGPVSGWEDRGGLLHGSVAGFEGESLQIPLAEPYGHASRPPADTELVFVRARGQHVIVGALDRHRPDLGPGEVLLYDAGGARVLCSGGEVSINGGVARVARQGDPCAHSLQAGPYTVTGTITINGGAEGFKA